VCRQSHYTMPEFSSSSYNTTCTLARPGRPVHGTDAQHVTLTVTPTLTLTRRSLSPFTAATGCALGSQHLERFSREMGPEG